MTPYWTLARLALAFVVLVCVDSEQRTCFFGPPPEPFPGEHWMKAVLRKICERCPDARIDLKAHDNVCSDHLGMEDGSIPNSRITASSIYALNTDRSPENCQPSNGRLHYLGSGVTVGGWCPAKADVIRPWFQVDLGERLQVEGVVIQGSIDPTGAWTERVSAYQVQYSDDQATWQYVGKTCATAAKTFPGNTDQTTPVNSMFDRPIRARYIRIRPTEFYNHPSMRVELIGCKGISSED